MAEILIQRRRHRNVWPWLLGLLALALLPLPFLGADRDDRPGSRRETARRDTGARRDTVSQQDTSFVPGVVPPGTARGSTAPGRAGGGGGPLSGPGSRGGTQGAPARAGSAIPSGERTTATAAGTVAPAPAAAAPAGTTSPAGSGSAAAPSSRATFEGFIAARPPASSDRDVRLYTSEALRLLAAELRELGASGVGVRAILANADSLRLSRRQTPHPDYARAAFLAAVRELDLLRARYRTPVDTGAVRAAAWSIRTDQTLLAQRAGVQRFFESARAALESLSRAAPARRAANRRER